MIQKIRTVLLLALIIISCAHKIEKRLIKKQSTKYIFTQGLNKFILHLMKFIRVEIIIYVALIYTI